MCTFGVLELSCASPGGPHLVRPSGLRDLQTCGSRRHHRTHVDHDLARPQLAKKAFGQLFFVTAFGQSAFGPEFCVVGHNNTRQHTTTQQHTTQQQQQQQQHLKNSTKTKLAKVGLAKVGQNSKTLKLAKVGLAKVGHDRRCLAYAVCPPQPRIPGSEGPRTRGRGGCCVCCGCCGVLWVLCVSNPLNSGICQRWSSARRCCVDCET